MLSPLPNSPEPASAAPPSNALDLVEYRKLNESFDRTLVFNLGVEAGFFSEFNNMILVMLHCLQQRIRFVLYSDDANFKVSKGWEDFFLPFCEETRDPELATLTWRFAPQFSPERSAQIVAMKERLGIDFVTHDLFDRCRQNDFVRQSFSLANRDGLDLQAAAGMLVSMLWRYNAPTQNAIDGMKRRVSLPDDYLGLHVRAGDKHTEARLVGIAEFMERVQVHSSLRDIFLLTDDYTIFEEACERFPDYRFATLCTPAERGYVHEDFTRLHRRVQQWRLLNLFSSIEVLASARYFFGSITTNPGMYLGMRMGEDRAFYIDCERWGVW